MATYRLFEAMHEMKAALMMVVVQVAFAGVNILYKLTASNGMNLTVIIAYQFIFATAFLAPLAFFLERKSKPKITWTVLGQAFFCGLFGGSLGQNLYLASLSMTSATYALATAILIPAVTFVSALSLGIGPGEYARGIFCWDVLLFDVHVGLSKLGWVRLRTAAGKAKAAGTLMGIDGAMLLTFYKVNLWSTHVNLLRHVAAVQWGQEGSSDLLLGSLLAVASCFCYASWLIIQVGLRLLFPIRLFMPSPLIFLCDSPLLHFMPSSSLELNIDSRFWAVLYFDRLVRADERTSVRVGFQSFDAGDRGLGRVYGVGREIAPREHPRVGAHSTRSVCGAVGQKKGGQEDKPVSAIERQHR
ncbi:LOW QUALITY PROTEIN: hypothetical protein BT93_G0620 [Corymbia citriodora subsp. variegata]|nr:LOW QUALITY PROTEIN: hypothetical protein BT93_G0620 [Corymbia citriodora subsp. variegata]